MKKEMLWIIGIITLLSNPIIANAKSGFYEENGNTYYANEEGEVQVGFQEIDGKIYFFSRDTKKWGAMRTGKLEIEGETYYFSPYAKTGLFEEEGDTYYANEEGKIQVGFQTIDEKIYFFSRDKKRWGVEKTGVLQVGDDTYHLDPYAKTGLFEEDGKTYYADEEGKIQVGFQEIEGKTYFFSRDKTKWGVRKTGVLQVGDDTYHLDPYAKTGIFKENGNTYYADETGKIQVGFQTIEDKIYFFSRDKTKWGVEKTGVLQVGDDTYHLDPYAKTGLFEENGNTYYADETGKIQVGFQKIEDKIYFFSRDKQKWGVERTGVLQVGDDIYHLDPYAKTGLFEEDGNTYYADDTGKIQVGFQKIEDKIYFFSRDKAKWGVLKTGWQYANNDIWYQDETGALVTGLQTIDGRDYEFSEETGLLAGFKKENGKTYYYDPDGTVAKGVQYIAGKFWQFNSITGVFEKNVRQIRVIDISSHNGNIDWETVKKSGQVDAVILRLGYGVGYIDTKFLENKKELERLGIPYSVYLFSYAENSGEALRESNFLVNTILDNNVKIAFNIFGIYYDLEDWEIKSTGESSYGISKETYQNMITTFVDNTEKKLCIKTRVYASKNYIETRFPESVQGYATWVAQWYKELTYKGPYEGWQYTSTGSVPGINGNVDMSYFYM